MSAPHREPPEMIFSCPHCRYSDATCCQCNRTGRVTPEIAQRSVAWVWDFEGCQCAACLRLRVQRLHIYRMTEPGQAPAIPGVVEEPPRLEELTARERHDRHAAQFGKSFQWCQHTNCVRVRYSNRRAS